MSRIDTNSRITRNLAIIRYQLEELSRRGMYMPYFTEELLQKTLNAASSQGVNNLNTVSNNFPGIDLRSADETVGYQATRHVTKAKYDKTRSALITELERADSRVTMLRDVYVVGVTCVNNAAIRRWTQLDPRYHPRIRCIELNNLLDLPSLGDDVLLDVDNAIQGFVNDWGRPRNSDAAEIRTIVGWLDRPAIRDSRALELSWENMNTAMEGIRRLIGQGVDDLGHPITRPWSTFREPYDQNLRKIYDASHQISRLLTPHLQGQGSLTSADLRRIDDLRLLIQARATDLCINAGIARPQW